MSIRNNTFTNGTNVLRHSMQVASPFLQNMGSQLFGEIQNQIAKGSHELGAALFTGNAFVMYGHTGSHDQSPMQSILNPPVQEASKEQTQEQSLEQSRGGIEI